MRVCVIFNPTAKGDRARRFLARLEGLGEGCELRPTTEAGEGMALAEAAVWDGFETIVAAGGDGTINEVVNGMARAEGLGRARLGVLPWGSVNVFAKELGIPERFEEAWGVVLRGSERLVDLGWMELGEEKVRRCFVQLAGAGLDGRAVELVDWETKKQWGDLAYVLAGWRALGEELPQITVRVAGETVRGQLALVGNGRFYGGRHVFFPEAKLDDGILDLVILEEVRRDRIFNYASAVLRDRVTTMEGVRCLRGDEFEMEAEGRVPVEMEGDAVGVLPARGWVERRVLRVLAG